MALDGVDPVEVLPGALAEVPASLRPMWAEVLAPGWFPAQARQPNGAVWPTLGTAVWALRRGFSFEEAMRAVIDLGGDTDTVACVTGGLLGAASGIQAIPSRWTTPLTGAVPGHVPAAPACRRCSSSLCGSTAPRRSRQAPRRPGTAWTPWR